MNRITMFIRGMVWSLFLVLAVCGYTEAAVDLNVDPGKAPPTAETTARPTVDPFPPATTGVNATLGNTSVTPENMTVTSAQAAVEASSDREYEVKPGDYLVKIAQELLGDGNRYWEIIEANKEKYPELIKNPHLIYPGWKFKIPNSARNNQVNRPTSNDYSAPVEGTVQVSSYLNVRSHPWGSIIGKLYQDDKVDIVSEEGDWFKIRFNGQTAYIHKNYVHTPNHRAGATPVKRPDSNYADAERDATITPGTGRFGAPPCSPMPSWVSSEYGPRDLFGHNFHYGIDLPVPNNTRLNALGDGVVTAVGYEAGGGHFIKIRYDNGVESFYCHLKSQSVRQGQRVSIGQEVARSDNTGQWTTGPHLHMGIKVNGQYVNPRSVRGIPLP